MIFGSFFAEATDNLLFVWKAVYAVDWTVPVCTIQHDNNLPLNKNFICTNVTT